MPTPNSSATLVKGARASRTTIALKLLMATTGLIFIGFVLMHMYGNLKVFSGHDAFNEYAEHIRTFGTPILPYGGLLWITRAVLFVSLVVHVWAAVTLARRAGKARTVRYEMKKHTGAIFASRLMRFGGLTIFLFVIWHLLHFTIVKVNVNPDVSGPNITEDPYNLAVSAFEVWWMTLIYLVVMAMLGAHLHHGVWSATQTLGITGSQRTRVLAKRVAFALAVLIAGGFSLVPIAVLLGIVER